MALQYEKESGHKGAAALVDTDFGSDLLTVDENNSADTLQRRKDVVVGLAAHKAVGHAWRSVDVSYQFVVAAKVTHSNLVPSMLHSCNGSLFISRSWTESTT